MAVALLAREAETDLDQIWLYIAQESGNTDIADRFVDRATALFLRIAAEPYLGRRRDELRAGMRSFPFGNHLVFYRVQEDTVLILRVLHGRRDIDALF